MAATAPVPVRHARGSESGNLLLLRRSARQRTQDGSFKFPGPTCFCRRHRWRADLVVGAGPRSSLKTCWPAKATSRSRQFPQTTPAAELLALVAEDLPTATPTLPPTVTPVPTLTSAPTTPTATPAPPTLATKSSAGYGHCDRAEVRLNGQGHHSDHDFRRWPVVSGPELIIPVVGSMGGGATATPTPESSAYVRG